jgi:hypothetical protein
LQFPFVDVRRRGKRNIALLASSDRALEMIWNSPRAVPRQHMMTQSTSNPHIVFLEHRKLATKPFELGLILRAEHEEVILGASLY